jgi:hypothetical protein
MVFKIKRGIKMMIRGFQQDVRDIRQIIRFVKITPEKDGESK